MTQAEGIPDRVATQAVVANKAYDAASLIEIITQTGASAVRESLRSAVSVRERGKGSHGTLYLGDRYTIMKDRKKEIGPGLLRKMLSNLGLDKSDIE